MQTNITTRIITDTVLKVKEANGFYYRGKVIVTLHDGQELEYAVKTKLNTFTPETVLVKTNGEWVEAQTSEMVNQVTAKFFAFLNLMKDCFFSKYQRNKLFLGRDRLLRDNTPAADRMAYSTRITSGIYLINGELIQQKRVAPKFSFERPTTVYSKMNCDLSGDWEDISDTDEKMHSLCVSAASEYRSGLGDYNLRKYHKELVNKGIRM